ncbi:MAG: FlaG family protein [Sulfurospirillum sp.]
MDIFSVANKQVAETAQQSVDTSMSTRRSVEKVTSSTKTEESNMLNKNDIKQKLDKTVKNLNEQMKSLDTNVTFGFNDKIDTMFVNVMERSTGKIIRKIPTEEAMKLSEKMKEIVGMIFDKKG